ncbi:glycoside hydrolase family 11 protein [Collybiopsis luxurians FD-317 M1]|uniref:Endo-1,4-beta-xylanase n=1 Tax=Collybiopsis luxurians FD-317 M1 TaxID=944289 RepID=A0A0D0CBQ2_9AGAR|nr:glycoside hydrolase family 11 protein [Collybiopsis luxurians FD-317 M1]
MVFLTSLLSAVAIAATGVSALPSNFTQRSDLTARQSKPAPGEGTFDGFFYSFYTAGTSDVIYTNIAGGQYEVQWDGTGDFVVGQGFNPGSRNQVITFGGTFGPNPASAALLSVYGWSINPLVEYYINEDSNNFDITQGATFKGTVTSDGSLYNIYLNTRVNEPSIQGTATFNQYLSVRQNKRTSGTVTVANHINAWAALGMELGTMNEQIMAVEGLDSSGVATITVS